MDVEGAGGSRRDVEGCGGIWSFTTSLPLASFCAFVRLGVYDVLIFLRFGVWTFRRV